MASPISDPPAGPAPAETDGPRPSPDEAVAVGRLDADRICQRCLHQLRNTTVYRDRRLDILYVRCTECGTNSAVTEYPHAWRWLRRLGMVFIAAVLLLGLGLLVADVAASTGLMHEMTREVTGVFAEELGRAGLVVDEKATWRAPPELLADRATIERIGADPALQGRASRMLLIALLPLGLAHAAFGMAWSIVLVHRRVVVALLGQFIPFVLAAALFVISSFLDQPNSSATWSYDHLAFTEWGPRYAAILGAGCLVVRLAAVLLARPILAVALWFLVPRRIRLAVASVWGDPPTMTSPE